jgi:four helix bundle protein
MPLSFSDWEQTQSAAHRGDPIWKFDAYTLSLFLLYQMRADLRAIRSRDTVKARDQLRAAVASIGANFAEGYSRPTLADRSRFYSYALGSVREAIWWYSALEDELGDRVVVERVESLSRIRRLLVGILKAVQARQGGGGFEV